MRVTVLYFGVLKERFGTAEEPAELADGATVGDLVRELQARTSNPTMGNGLASGAVSTDARLWQSIAVAVNREYAGLDAALREGDEVALLPPVSGGSFADGGTRAARAAAVPSAKARALLAEEAAR